MAINKPRVYEWRYDYPRHLDSPLTQNNILFYATTEDLFRSSYPDLPYGCLLDLQSGMIQNKALFPALETYLSPLLAKKGREAGYQFPDIANIALTSVHWQMKALMDKVPFPHSRGFENLSSVLLNNIDLRRLYFQKLGIFKLHDELTIRGQKCEGTIKIPWIKCLSLQKDLVLITHVFQSPIIVTYDMLLCVLDKIESMFTFELVITLMDSIPLYNSIGFGDKQRKLYSLLDQMYLALGNKAHYILKALEGLTVGVLLTIEPEDTADHLYLQHILQSFNDKDEGIAMWGNRIAEEIRSWATELGNRGRIVILEAYGQEKLHFFPIADDEGGQLKMYSVGTSFREVDAVGCKRIKGYLVQQLVWSIYTKSKELPPINPSLILDVKILDLYASKVVPSRSSIFGIDPLHWEKVQFKKHFQFNYRPDNFDLLIDRSIAPDLKNINQIWHPDVRKMYGLSTPPCPSERRFIAWVMKTPNVDSEEYFNDWELHNTIPSDQTVILATAKEREQKNEMRSYSILHPIPRVCLTTIEFNLSEQILPLLPFHSMSLSGPQLQKRIETFVNPAEDDGMVTIFFTLDYEQWNYTFRDRSTVYFDMLFNQLFGVNHFNWPNRLFREATIFTGNPFTPPNSPGQFTTWNHHAGGNQGIRQKFWTIITQAAISLAMENLGFPTQLIGSGDNQVLAVRLPSDGGLPHSINRVKTAIQEESSALGIAIKLAETFHSQRLFVYQRKYYSDGHPISLAIKGCVRFFAGSSDGAPTLANVISTSQNSGMQLSSATGDPLIGIICGHLESYTALLNHSAWQPTIRLHPRRLAAISLLSSDLMPLNFLQLPGYLYSGHKDMLTECLALLNHIYESNPEDRIHIAGVCFLKFKPLTTNWELALVLDPKAPNIDWPQTAESFIRDRLKHYLLTNKITRNRQIRATLSNLNDIRLESFAMGLLKIRPLNLTIAHSLFECSRTGQVLASVNRFSKVRTIFKLADDSRRSEDQDPLSTIISKRDMDLVSAVCYRVSRPNYPRTNFYQTLLGATWTSYLLWCNNNGSVPLCSYNVRRYLIIKSYMLNLEDIIGPYCPAPFEQISLSLELDSELIKHAILINPSRTMPPVIEGCEYTRGPFSRYIGSATASRVQSYKFFKLSGGDMSTSINLLFSLGTWLSQNGGCPNLDQFVVTELNSRIPDLDIIYKKVKASSRGGCLEHRFSSPGEVTGSYSSSLSLISTHYRLNTDQASHFNRSEDDFELFFQPSFHFIHSLLRFCEPLKVRMLAVIELSHCTRQITNRSYTGPPITMYCPGNLLSAVQISERNRSRIQKAMNDSFLASNQDNVFVPTREKGLIAFNCEIAATYIRKYQTYHQYSEVVSSSLGRPESVINLSLLRGVDLASFLLSFVITLDYHGVFGVVHEKSAIAARLHNWSRAISGIVDVNMFKFITDAISQIGKLGELCAIARSRYRYIRMNRAHSLAPVLLLAMANVVREDLSKGLRWTIITKEPGAPAIDRLLCSMIRKWCYSHRKNKIGNSNQDILNWAKSLRFVFKEGQMITCNVVGTIEEIARSLPYVEIPKKDFTLVPSKQLASNLLIRLTVDNISQSLQLDDRLIGNWRPARGVDLGNRSMRSTLVASRMYQTARWGGTVSGAWTKIALVLSHYWVRFMACRRGLFLAEGGGSMISFCLHANTKMMAVYNSLYEIEITDGVEDGGFMPPALMCECNAKDRVVNLPYLDKYYGDISMRQCRNQLYVNLSSAGSGPILMTCDIDTWSEGRGELFSALIDESILHGVDIFVLKFFRDDLRDKLFVAGITRSTAYFTIRCHKPFTSNIVSSEAYLVFIRKPTPSPTYPVFKSIRIWGTVMEDVSLTSTFRYFDHLIRFCKEVEELPPCLDGSPISSANSQDHIKHTMGTIYEAFMIVHTLRRDLVGDTDLLAREIGVLFHSAAKGSVVMKENFWSLMVATAVSLIIAGYTNHEIANPSIAVAEVNFINRVIPLLTTVFGKVTLPSIIDSTWRRIGYLFRSSPSFGTPADIHFLLSMRHYTHVNLKGLRVKLNLPKALDSIIDLAFRDYQLHIEHEMPIVLFRSGLRMIERVFKSHARDMGTECRLLSIAPPWMEDVIRARQWPVTFSLNGKWGLVVGQPSIKRDRKWIGVQRIVYIHLPRQVMTNTTRTPTTEDYSVYEFEGAGLHWRVDVLNLR